MADRCYTHRTRCCKKDECQDPPTQLELGPVEDNLSEAQWLGWHKAEQ